MIRLKKGNIERIVDSQEKGDEYIAKGFILLEQAGQATLDTRKKQLSEMTVEEMMAYAAENGIDIGKASSAEGILKKITEALQGAIGGDNHGNDESGKAESSTGDNNQ